MVSLAYVSRPQSLIGGALCTVCVHTQSKGHGRTRKESGHPLGVMTQEPEDSPALSLSTEFTQSQGNTRETVEDHCMLAHPQAHAELAFLYSPGPPAQGTVLSTRLESPTSANS